ncbi:MAG: sugar ABC transporter substrate-binding protein [Alphaproteobacteria bacterium]
MLLIRRTVGAAMVGAAMALSAGSASAQEEGRVYQIAFITPSFDISDAWERVYYAAQARLDELGVEYETQLLSMERHNDHATQLQQVESVIARGVDYVFFGPAEFETAVTPLRMMNEAGIGVVVYNFLEPHAEEDARALQYIAFDHHEGGRLTGEWIALNTLGKGMTEAKVAIIQGTAGVVSDQRRDGILSVLDMHPTIEVVLGPYADFDRVKGYEAAQNLMAAHDDLDLIIGLSTTMGLGAAQAIRQAGLSDQIMSMGYGGTADEIVAINEGWLSASISRNIDDSGAQAADTWVKHMNGELDQIPVSWSGPYFMIDAVADADAFVAHATRYSRPVMGR